MCILTVRQKKVGVLPKDNSVGPVADEWKKVFSDASKDIEEFDISVALSTAAFSAKDENELVRLHPYTTGVPELGN